MLLDGILNAATNGNLGPRELPGRVFHGLPLTIDFHRGTRSELRRSFDLIVFSTRFLGLGGRGSQKGQRAIANGGPSATATNRFGIFGRSRLSSGRCNRIRHHQKLR